MDEKEEIGLYLYAQTYKEKSGGSSKHGIFAFVENEIESEDFFIQEGCYLFRENNNIKVYKSHSEHGMNAESIFRVKVDNNHFKISIPFLSRLKPPFVKLINNLKNNLYYVMNSYPEDDNKKKKRFRTENDDYYLNENDIIKIGNMIYIVRKLFIKSNANNNDNERDKDKDKVYDIEYLNKDKSPIFDTCFMKKFDEKIISELTNIKEPTSLNLPKEAFNYCFHIINYIKDSITIEKKKKCFSERISITETKNKNVTNYIFDLFKCEECKETTHLYPLRYLLPNDEKLYELIEIKEPENTNYLILESLEEVAQNEKEKVKENLKKYIHVVKLTEEGQTFYIGRGDKSDIKLDSDNKKVSSKHAVIIFLNGKVILKNISEKLNTSVLIKTIKEDLEIKEKEIYLEAGRSFIEAKIMTKEEYEKIKIK